MVPKRRKPVFLVGFFLLALLGGEALKLTLPLVPVPVPVLTLIRTLGRFPARASNLHRVTTRPGAAGPGGGQSNAVAAVNRLLFGANERG